MLIKVRVFPNSRKESIEKDADGTYRIKVRVPAERNQANVRARELLATALGQKPGAVKLVVGHRGPNKRFEVNLKVNQ
jgi:uncharacterized protein YggU (UPF0235/DUF167 family)